MYNTGINRWIIRDQDSDDDDIEKKIADLAGGGGGDDSEEDVPKPKAKKNKKKTAAQAMSAFAMLDMEDGGGSDQDSQVNGSDGSYFHLFHKPMMRQNCWIESLKSLTPNLTSGCE